MKNPLFPHEKLLSHCESVYSILSSYYAFESIPNIKNFLLAPCDVSTSPGQVFIEELEEEVFIGIQFGKEIVGHMTSSKEVTPNDVSVLAEELSHFKFLADVVEKEAKTSLLILETMGEIDRFLCVMHWNQMAKENAKFTNHWKNIHEICDYVFTGDRFHHKDKKLYIEAENLAFKHLKEAFAEKWDCTHFNFSEINQSAQNYLQPLRRKFLSL